MGIGLHIPGLRAQVLRPACGAILPGIDRGSYLTGKPNVLPLCTKLIKQGSITYLSMFYSRSEMGKRVALFFSATSLAGAFSGLLAAAILNMDGKGGKAGWAWIFILCVYAGLNECNVSDSEQGGRCDGACGC